MATLSNMQSKKSSLVQFASPEHVLSFWFGTPAKVDDELTRIRRWFRGGVSMDKEVAHRFGPSVKAALRHRLDGWTSTARGRLALVLLLDQMTRSLFRNDALSYSGDTQAQSLSADAFDRGLHLKLEFPECMFLLMPMVHAEDLALQERSALLATELVANAPPIYPLMAAMMVEQTAKYLEVIRRFGRFPHRNAILGRTSTLEEIEFLKTWAIAAVPKSIGITS